MIKVSIIVPVHNAQAYLHTCVDSLLGQTMEELEIILVDDCSEDSSRAIIQNYVSRFPDKVVGLYLDTNIRQGGARNRGMTVAGGEYIAFVDADDFIEPEMCQTLYDAAQGADMAGADYYLDTGESKKLVTVDYGKGVDMTAERRAWFIGNCGFFWCRIYRRAFLEAAALRFPEGTFYEDAHFNFMTALYAKTAVKAKGAFYHYYQSPNSTMRNRNNPHQYERIAIPSLIIGDCRQRGIYEEHKALVDYKYITMQMGNIRYTCLGQFDTPDVRQLARIRKAIKRECRDFAKCPYYKSTLFQLRVYLRLTLLWPRLAIWGQKADRLIDLLAVIHGKLKRQRA